MRKKYLALILAAAIALPQILGTGQVVYASQMPEEQIAEESGEKEMTAKTEESVEELKTLASDIGIYNFFISMSDDNRVYIVESGAIVQNPSLPKGISYDPSGNVLKLENANVDCIEYEGKKNVTIRLENANVGSIMCSEGDLTIESYGKNQISGLRASEYDGYGDLYLKGTGTIETDVEHYVGYIQQEGLTYNENAERIMADVGDIYIEGITLIIHNGGGIVSCNSNVTIRNAMLKINDQALNKYAFGITTGRAEWDEAYKGLLTIENSEIEIKKCTLGLAWNRINMTGCNLYLGESSPEYKINPATTASYDNYGSFKRGYFENINYLKITKDNLNLPSAYALVNVTASDAGGTISMPKFAVAGKKINVDVRCDDSYTLSKLYVNGTTISGTSFTMPDKDTTVKAVFVKKSGSGTAVKKEVKVTKISLSGISKKIASGKKITLKADVFPSNATNKAVTWKSSNTKYATVNSKGVVTMKKAGKGKTVTITATAKDGSQTKAAYKIKCMKGVVKKIKLTAAKTVKAGKKVTVKNKVTASKGANTALAYSVSNKKYATVNKKGVVTTKKAGKGKTIKVTAKATDGSGKKAAVKIKIK